VPTSSADTLDTYAWKGVSPGFGNIQYTGLLSMKKQPDSLLSACAPEMPPSSAKKEKCHIEYSIPCIINIVCAFLKVNKLFKILTHTVDSQNISVLLLNNIVLKKHGFYFLCGTAAANMQGSTTHAS
jgi:hypothetical protein